VRSSAQLVRYLLGALIRIPLAAAVVTLLAAYSHRDDLVREVLNVGAATTEPEPG
jgi:hypothetical protein